MPELLVETEAKEQVRLFKSVAEAKAALNTYVRTNWDSHKLGKPLVMLIKNIAGPQVGQSYSLDVILGHNEKEMQIPLDYPLIHLSAEEAKMRIAALQQQMLHLKKGTKEKATQVSLLKDVPSKVVSNQNQPNSPMDETNSLPVTNPTPEPATPATPTVPEAAQETAVSKTPTSAYSIMSNVLKNGGTKDEAVAEALKAYPTEDPKQLKLKTHSIAAMLKKKKTS